VVMMYVKYPLSLRNVEDLLAEREGDISHERRLEASYVAPNGSRARPLMIHHAIFGSLGRMIAILLEQHGGVLPFWLSPEQSRLRRSRETRKNTAQTCWRFARMPGSEPLSMTAPTPFRGAS
jgi:hypothetical protein